MTLSSAELASIFLGHLLDRLEGPLAFRFVLQPIMAAAVAIRDGIRDGRTGAPPYGLALFGPPSQRRAALSDGLRATSRILVLALVLDAIYQVIVFREIRPGETMVVAILLAIVPYTLVRGPVARIVKLARGRAKEAS